MNDVLTLIDIAVELKNQGQKEESLGAYSKAFDALVDESGIYAKSQLGDSLNVEDLRPMTPKLIEYSKVYLKQDITAASILNEMGNLFTELGDYDNAKQKYNEAIDLIPDGVVFDEPSSSIANLPVRSDVEIVSEGNDEEVL